MKQKKNFIQPIVVFVTLTLVVLSTVTVIAGIGSLDYRTSTNSLLGTTLYVGGTGANNYTAIQDAVDAASAGDTIYVYAGIYYENVQVDKTLSIIGENETSTIIDADEYQSPITLLEDSVHLSHLLFRNSDTTYLSAGVYIMSDANVISHCIIQENGKKGVIAWYSYYNTIEYCTIDNNTEQGIDLGASNHHTLISNCVIENNGHGAVKTANPSSNITINNCFIQNDQIILQDARDCVVSDCFLRNPFYFGIRLQRWSSVSSNIRIENNTISECLNNGIELEDSDSNIIHNNTFINNEQCGLFIDSSSNDNLMYHNNFFNNTQNAIDEGTNLWDDGTQGNYWDDYLGGDTNEDGLGDTPYTISSRAGQDNYPLIHPYGSVTNKDTNEIFLTIQQALDDTDTTNGHTIYVKPGTYNEHVYVVKEVILEGENAATTIIDGSNTGRVVFINTSNVHCKKFTIQHSGSSLFEAGIWVTNAQNCVIRENIVKLNAQGIALADNAHYNLLYKNTITDNSRDGVYVSSSNYNDNIANIINTNTVTSNGMNGVFLWGADTSVYDNIITDNEFHGIHDTGTNSVIIGNDVSINNEYGIYLETGNSGPSDLTVLTDNTVSFNPSGGIFISLSQYNYLSGNTISNNAFGVRILPYSGYSELTGNTITNNLGEGISVGGSSSHCQITGNTISNNDGDGIILMPEGHIDMTYIYQNTIFENNNGIVLESSTNLNTILDNNIMDNTNYGIYTNVATQNTIRDNTIVGNTARGIHVHNSNSNTIYNNYIDNTNNAFDDNTNNWNIPKTAFTNIIYGPYQGGNYYSDYPGFDTDGDGLGDTETYPIPGGTNEDIHPLCFTGHHPPITPHTPFPAPNGINVPLTVPLRWYSGDPYDADELLYEIYFGTTIDPDPPYVETIGFYPGSQSVISYTLPSLAYDTTYYWRIIVWDSYDNFIEGPLWNFTTPAERPCGDTNADATISISDAISLINYVLIPGSPAPEPICIGDVNNDDFVDLSDAIYIINYIFDPMGNPPSIYCCEL